MSKITLEFDTEQDSERSINAAVKADLLALCIWEMKERIRKEWEECDEGDKMDKLINDINEIVEDRIGCIDLYTE